MLLSEFLHCVLHERPLTEPRSTIVATGLIALVDDCIERRWHSKRNFHLDLPKYQATDAIGPDQLIDKVFNRPVHTKHQGY